MSPTLSSNEISSLRNAHYNATLTAVREVHDDLRVIRLTPDRGVPPYLAGQFTTLGLGFWEPRAPHTQVECLSELAAHKMVKRAYSISFPIIDGSGKFLNRADCDFLEFYVALVSNPPSAILTSIFRSARGIAGAASSPHSAPLRLESIPRRVAMSFDVAATMTDNSDWCREKLIRGWAPQIFKAAYALETYLCHVRVSEGVADLFDEFRILAERAEEYLTSKYPSHYSKEEKKRALLVDSQFGERDDALREMFEYVLGPARGKDEYEMHIFLARQAAALKRKA